MIQIFESVDEGQNERFPTIDEKGMKKDQIQIIPHEIIHM
jgi:hypothetical protein